MSNPIQKRIFDLKIHRIPQGKQNFKVFKDSTPLPSSVDLRSKMPPVYDQGPLGSCTANALVANFQFDDPSFMGSRLFLYYNERVLEQSIQLDSGALLSDGIVALQKYGICEETDWPYQVNQFAQKPPPICYQKATFHKALSVQNIHQDLSSIQQCLSSGLPFVVGIQVFQEFESPFVTLSGKVPIPTSKSVAIGGHAILVCGYNNTTQKFICRNSWGPKWGDKGYFYLPYAYLLNPQWCSDFWVVKKVSTTSTSIVK
jgi:C1A family cysteine protease